MCISDADCIDHLIRAGCSEKVIAHARTVRCVIDEYTGDEAVISSCTGYGALLHDIGRSKSHAIDHAIIGGDLCRDAGISEDIALMVERHLGAGQTADECIQLRLLPRECMPLTLSEKIVAHADNLVKGTTVIHIEERMIRIADLPKRKRRRTYRLALEMELFSR